MKLGWLVTIVVAACTAVHAQQAMPRMTTVEPNEAKVGDVVAVTGENLQKEQVAKVFLTDGKVDIPVTITEQAATTLKFKLPKATPGRFALMILTAGKDSKYIEQPVKVTVQQ
jgi:hypothetical protein